MIVILKHFDMVEKDEHNTEFGILLWSKGNALHASRLRCTLLVRTHVALVTFVSTAALSPVGWGEFRNRYGNVFFSGLTLST